jgi:curved DNA-binding protein
VRGADLYHDLDLSPWEAVLGAAIDIPTLDGTVSLKVPPGTMAGRDFRLRGLGLPTASGVRGDLHAMVGIQVPAVASPEQQTLWRSLASSTAFNPRCRP